MRKSAAANKPSGSWEWAVCGASVTGSEHHRKGLGCDDAYCYGVAGDFVVAAVADGAGSVTGTSAWGSYTACQSVVADATEPRFIDQYRATPVGEREPLVRWLFDQANRRVHQQAEDFGMDVSLLSTTLCVAVADRDAAVFGQIGDGIIAAESGDQIRTLLIETKNEYANATWFIQSDGAFDAAYRSETHSAVISFALSTDGMAYKITSVATGEAYQPFFRGSWEHVRAGVSSANLTALLRSIEDDQTGDDKTLVLAARRWQEGKSHRSERLVYDSSAPPPPLPGLAHRPRLVGSPHAGVDNSDRDRATAIPVIAEAKSFPASPEPDTDELPLKSSDHRRRGLIRRRPR
jgi:Protein phosphatase 2C